MTASSWTTGTSGDWNTAANWTGGVPNDPTANVTIDAAPVVPGGNYTVTLATGESAVVNSLVLNGDTNNAGTDANPYNAAFLEVDGTLTFAPGSAGTLDGPLTSIVMMNSGTMVNAGVVNAFVQATGNSEFIGTNGVYFTNQLEALGGTVTVDTSAIAEMSPNTLFDGIFVSQADANNNYAPGVINLGGVKGGLIPDITTIQGPPTIPDEPNGWTQLIYSGTDPSAAIMEWNGTAYVPVESTITTIGSGGIITAQFGAQYATTNALTIENGGYLEQTSGLLTTGGLTIDAGGILTNGISVGGASTGTVIDSLDLGTLTIAGNVVNNGVIEGFASPIVLTGSLTGSGSLVFESTGTFEVQSVGALQTVTMIGDDTLVLDNPAQFGGSVAATGTGNTIVLTGVTADNAVVVGNMLDIRSAGVVIDSIALTGTSTTGATLTEVGGNAQIVIGGQASGGPVVTAGASASYTQGNAPTLLDATVTVTDPNQPTLTSATVSISTGFLAGDMLSATVTAGVTASYDATTGILTLAGTASVADYQTMLDSVMYSAAGDPTHGGVDTARTLSWTVNDGLLTSAVATSALTVQAPVRPTPYPGEVVLQGASNQYIIADDNGSLYIQDTVAGRDGTQDLSGVTLMQFSDGDGVFDPTGSVEDVARLYQAALGRQPDVAGAQYWAGQIDNANVPLSDIASAFAASPEFVQDYGALSDSAFVNQMYQNVLGRAADTDGAAYWDNAMASGMTRGTVLMSFSQSQEFEAKTLTTGGDVNNAEATRLYTAGLGRAPDAAGEAFWSAQLANGEAPIQVAQDFVNSAEFQSNYGALSASDFVSAMYQNVLHRAGDAAGQQYWTNVLQQGASTASVMLSFADSTENRINTAAATHANWAMIPA